MASLVGIGNPLLDISVVCDEALLEKYGLKNADAILAEEKHFPLFDELISGGTFTPEYIAGGATQNSVRVAQWMMQDAGATAFLGCVGKDANGETLRKCAAADGVDVHYLQDEAAPTGLCATLVVDSDRSLCTRLDAANNYALAHLETEGQPLLDAAKLVYSSGFHLTVSPDGMLKAATECKDSAEKQYALNLAAPFLMQVPPFWAAMNTLLPLSDFVFGNEDECDTFADAMKWDKADRKAVALQLAALPKDGPGDRVVVITQGLDPVIVATAGVATEYPIVPIAKDKLVDTNGAGDAFVGGFLAGVLKKVPLDKSVAAGIYASSVIVQTSGTKLPATPPSHTL